MKLKRKLCYIQGALYVSGHSTSKGACRLNLNNSLYGNIEMNNDWLSDAIQDDAELWQALSAEHCLLPPLSAAITITTFSHGEHFIHDYMYLLSITNA